MNKIVWASGWLWCALLCGCGAPAEPFGKFVGTWSYQAGSSVMAACPAPIGNTNTMLTGNVRVVAGLDADLVVLDAAGCNVPYTVDGDVATAKVGHMCTHPGPQMGVTQSNTVTSGSFTNTDGKTMTGTGVTNSVFTSQVGSITCTVTLSVNLRKVSDD
jgi:hypothetical protein